MPYLHLLGSLELAGCTALSGPVLRRIIARSGGLLRVQWSRCAPTIRHLRPARPGGSRGIGWLRPLFIVIIWIKPGRYGGPAVDGLLIGGGDDFGAIYVFSVRFLGESGVGLRIDADD